MSERARDCGRFRAILHDILDGDPPPADTRRRYATHLEGCPDCRRADRELRALQRQLGTLARVPMPDAALDRVWEGTLGRRSSATRGPIRLGAAAAAAAAVLVLAGAAWLVLGPGSQPQEGTARTEAAASTEELTEEQLAHYAAQTRAVLALTAGALRRTEQAGIRRVLAGEVSPALSRVPIEWPRASPRSAEGRRDGA